MIASAKTVEEVHEYIGATSLAYISHEGLVESTRRPESELCRACLTREYPTAVPVEHAKLRFEPARAGRPSAQSPSRPRSRVASPSSGQLWSATSRSRSRPSGGRRSTLLSI